MKRVAIISDLHCGHRAGLTPPEWQYQEDDHDVERKKFATLQRRNWEFYRRTLEDLQPIDVLIVNGDCIDGKGDKSGGTELLEADRLKQVTMAVEAINQAQAKDIVITYGTPYHTGVSEDFENGVAEGCGARTIGGHHWVDVNGLVFDCKHKIASTSVPQGRGTAAARDVLWNMLWSIEEGQPRGNVFIRSHVHYFNFAGTDKYLALTTPALLGSGDKYGTRQCSGIVNFGLLSFDVEGKDNYSWKPHLLNVVTSVSDLVLRL
ncbi:MAG TPA: hypothetical protein VLH60_01105 [Sedimentisphaerales bacterium]|nr:hypothetical protein [Sedimentisphaerales bacterium]